MEDIECNLQREMLSLFYNSWLNIKNPVTQINKYLLSKYKNRNYWIFSVDKLLKKIGFSDAGTLLKQKIPTKSSWKKIVKEKVIEIQEEKWKAETSEKKTLELFFPGDYQLDGKLSKLINFQTSPRDVACMRMNVRLLIGDFPNNVNLSRTKRAEYDYCDYCDHEYSVINKDTNEHALLTCPLITDKDDLSLKFNQLISTVCYISGITYAAKLCSSRINLLHFIANPTSVINCYLHIPDDQLQNITILTQRYILSCHNERRKIKRKLKIRKPKKSKRRPDQNQLLPVQEDSRGKNGIEKYFKKINVQENNWPDYGLQNLLGEENTESELIGGILGIRASLIVGQVATEYGRRTLWKHGVIRMSQEQGVTKLFVVVSDCM